MEQMEMPRYRSHKEVWALKIKDIFYDLDLAKGTGRETDGSAMLSFEEISGTIKVSHEYIRRHKPQVGGYFVVYEDGYKSWSPAKAFEEGYTRVN